MSTISKEWVRVSESIYGQPFIDELANFLRVCGVKTILECGCGGGHILYGLAKRGFRCKGIDSDIEMFTLSKRCSHQNLSFEQFNWLDLGGMNEKFDFVMCRGNSLGYVDSWNKKSLRPDRSKKLVRRSLELMFDKVSLGGLLYVDTTTQNDLEAGKNYLTDNSKILGLDVILYSSGNTRYFQVHKRDEFVGTALSYVLSKEKLEYELRRLNPKTIFRPSIENEKNYVVFCAEK